MMVIVPIDTIYPVIYNPHMDVPGSEDQRLGSMGYNPNIPTF